MLKEQWANEQRLDKEAEAQRAVLNRERNIELIKHNEAERQLKNAQLDAEKARDK